jgi:L-gulonolactone oxidase
MTTTELGRRTFLRMGASAASICALPFFSGCSPCKVATNYAWNNALRTDGLNPDHLLEPTTLQELVAIVQKAEAERLGVRLAGAGHSFSDVAMSRGYQLVPWHLNQPLPLDRAQLRQECQSDPSLFRTEAGARIRHLNEALFAAGRGLEIMGGYDAQTLFGAATTGTHGSSLGHGPIASQIVSMQLVGTGGAVIQLEPHAGITDPARFPNYVEAKAGRVPATLIQDTATFNAVLVSMGCMGIVYAVVLRTVPRYWLKETRQLTTWGELTKPDGFLRRLLSKQRLAPDLPEDPEFYEIYFNPYPPDKSAAPASHHCILTTRFRMNEPPASLSHDDQKRGVWGARLQEIVANVSGQGSGLADYFNAHPQRVPKVLDQALASLRDKSYVDVSYDVFNLGPANLIRVYGVELAFDLQQTIAVTERHFQIAAELQKREIMHSSPPSLRFVKASGAPLAMSHGRETMLLEMGMIVCANASDELLKTYERRYIDEFKARPHWGLDLNMLQSFDQVRALYPGADAWLDVYKRMNARGTFNAQLTDRLGISMPVSRYDP